MKTILTIFCLGLAGNAYAGAFDNNVGNVASNECVAKVQRLITAVNTYWTLPRLNTMERKDTFSPNMVSRDPFRGIGSGSHNIAYDVSSQYATDDQNIKFNINGGNRLTYYFGQYKPNANITFSFSGSSDNCSSNTKWTPSASTTQVGMYFTTGSEMLFFSDISTLCANPNLTMTQALAGARQATQVTARVAGQPAFCIGGTSVTCTGILGQLAAVTNNMPVRTFCDAFQNGN